MRFAGTRADLEPGILKFEAETSIKYVPCGFHLSPDPETFRSAFEIPDFGQMISLWYQFGKRIVDHTGGVSQTYLVLLAGEQVTTDPIPQGDGTILYNVNFENNPRGFYFTPGGLLSSGALAGGAVSTVASLSETKDRATEFGRTLAKGFGKALDYYLISKVCRVGPEAMSMLTSGRSVLTFDFHPLVLPLSRKKVSSGCEMA